MNNIFLLTADSQGYYDGRTAGGMGKPRTWKAKPVQK